ncbi:hypothetical protein [Microvirga subterranea]|uniref:Uncharacterized protein n=1 Tax=Microvirga subterranea TaxID=186651 RepID=A0A370HIR1_9HYPH|nr:hypothetical protein [Microvirga subterranea]RDI57347.1 hypothetical protein DES45_107267 [Microvirga subterranea]
MIGKDLDRTEGLAEQSLNTSIVHPGQSSPDHEEPSDGSRSNRSITGNDQRKGFGQSDAPKPGDRSRPE